MVVRKVTCLEQLGLILKERRQELKYSLEDMSKKTKLSIIQLEAIEAGDIQFFIDDLSYLSYFVRYYSNALDLDFNDIRDQLDDSIMAYTDSINLTKVRRQEEINSRVLKTTKPGKQAKKSIDFASIGLFAISVVIIIALGFAIVKVVIPSLGSKDPIEPPVVTLPNDEEEEPDKESPEKPDEEEPAQSTLAVASTDSLNYEITGWNEDEEVILDLDFKNKAWVRFTEDDVQLDAPAQGIYEKDDNAKVILKAKKDKVISVNVGYVRGNVFSLNGEEVAMNEDIANSPSAHVFNFKFTEGATTE